MSSPWVRVPTGAAIIIIQILSSGAATKSFRSTFMFLAIRRPPKLCYTGFRCCKRKFAARELFER